MTRNLVTGGAGFIGSHLCKRLLEKDEEVVCVDNFYTGQKQNLAHLMTDPNFTLFPHDVTLPFPHHFVDRVWHLACPASPIHYQRDPVFTGKTAVLGAINALELARSCNARILLASTSEVYGDPEVHPQPESYRGNVNTFGPRSCYDEGKRMSETLFHDFHKMYGVDIRVVRIFNTYGPKMAVHDGRVVSSFITQALRGEDITAFGDGTQTRSFQYVSDLISGLERMMDQTTTIGPVNIGNPNEFTIEQLAQMVIEKTKSKGKIVYSALPEDDPKQRKPDIRLANEVLGWFPKVHLDEGLDYTIEYFKKHVR